MAAYTMDELVNLIDQNKDSPMGYALYNGLSGMNGGGLASPGMLTTALRNKWGEQAAKDWVASGTTKYGNTTFDPSKGEWGGWGEAYGQGGAVTGWDPSRFDPSATFTGQMNYNPTTNFFPQVTTPPAGETARPGTGTAPVASGTPRPGGAPTAGPSVPTVGGMPNQQGTPRTGGVGTPPAGAGGMPTVPAPGGAGGSPTAGGAPTGSTTSTSASQQQTLEQRARQILGSYFITKPDGTPDWQAMSGNTDFYNSLPDAIKMQITDAKLGAAMRTAAGLPLLPGMTLPEWYASAGSGVNNGAYTPPTYNAPTYGAPEPWQDTSGDVMDYFDDAGYKFRLDQGQRAIDTSRAASGSLLSGKAVKEGIAYAEGLASEEFDKANQRRNQERNFSRGVYQDDRDTGRQNFESDRGFGRNVYEGDRSFDFTNYKDLRDFLEAQRVSNRDFDESGRRWGLSFDKDTAISDRDFNEMMRRFDLTFDRDTASGDRAFEWGTLKDLAQMGLSGSQMTAQQQAALATLITNNILASGNAGAAGAIGDANAINAVVSGIISQIFGNKAISAVTGGG